MLMLSRRRGETIMIGDCITVTVTEVEGGKVRLGIDAPPNIPVHREEVYYAVQRERQVLKLPGGKSRARRQLLESSFKPNRKA